MQNKIPKEKKKKENKINKRPRKVDIWPNKNVPIKEIIYITLLYDCK